MPRRRISRLDDRIPIKPIEKPEVQSDINPKTDNKTQAVMLLQRTLGNQYVQRVMDKPPVVQKASLDQDGSMFNPNFIPNPDAREDTQKECREVMKAGLFALLRNKTIQEQGVEPPTDIELKADVEKYAKYRLRNEPHEFEFKDDQNKLTLGERKPESLTEKIEDLLKAQLKNAKGWHLFGLSLMDAERSVLLAVDNRKPSALRIYWMDRTEGGFKDVTGHLDEKITRVTQEMWLAQPPDRRHRTRVTIWMFTPP
ncbi:MAG: hypothetical protein JXA42_23950 [Anaerolineales bacterium]|nr:hypothetical protein [Anaerolineales bacterium]